MNEFDQFIKHKLKTKYYIRYADDFVIFNRSKEELSDLISRITDFLEKNLKLSIHPKKIFIKTMASGVDFLGWIYFPDHKILKTSTKRRMFKRIKDSLAEETSQSYFELLKHGNTFKLEEEIFSQMQTIDNFLYLF